MNTVPTPTEYIKLLKACRRPEDIEAVASDLYNSLNTGVAERTLANKLTPYNKAVRAEFTAENLQVGQNAYIKQKADSSNIVQHLHFKFTTDLIDFEKHNQKSTAALDTRMDNPAVVHAGKFLDCMIECLESQDEYELSAGLIAASGRRAIEVWRLGEFTKTTDPYSVTFKGQAKRRDYGVPKDERASYEIRLLIPAEAFLKLWRQFKQSEGYKSCQAELKAFETTLKSKPAESREAELRQKFHSLRGRSIDRAIKRTFGESEALENLDSISKGHQASSHVLRHAAVNLLVQRDVKSSSTGKALKFTAEQLGHYISGEDSIRSFLASFGYINFEVMGEVVTLDNAFKTATVRLNHADLERFNALAAHLNARNQQQAFHWLLNQGDRVIELEKELAELRRQVAEPKPAAETTTTEPVKEPEAMPEQNVESLIDNKIAALEERLLAALAGQQQATPKTAPTQGTYTAEPATIVPVATEEPKTEEKYQLKRAIDSRGEAALEKVAAAYWAIAEHNEKQLTDSDRWYIGPRLLKDLSGVNYNVVKRWVAEHETEIEEHNQRFELGSSHNRQHGRKGLTIDKVVKL
ncbi:protelomerase family protein [Nodosilinea sp. AN01ver1]|uniref:protelomerase family protein n=1 Tax=Nodosilinea sp. AN01ver1 TaxID=3423362 RepID=UPI003D314A31